MFVLRAAKFMALGLMATLAYAQQPAPIKPAGEITTPWTRGNRVAIGVTQERLGFSALWRFERAANGDIVLEKEEHRGGQSIQGALMLVGGGGALLLRELRPERGQELDALNGPMMMLQLVLRLLERAVPAGPQSLAADRKVSITESSAGIKVAGIGSEGEFFAPWSLKGTVGPAAAGQVKFELEFVSAPAKPGAPRYESSIAGIWQNVPNTNAWPDSFSLRGWRVHQIRNVVKPRGTINVVGPGTSPAMVFATLGEVRRSVAQWAIDGERRARHQCS